MTDSATTSGPESDPGAPFWLAGAWRVDPSLNLLVGPGGEHRVPDKFMQVLVHLAGHPGLVARQDLMDAVWPDSVVVDEALTRAVSELRKLLGDDPREPRFIETIPKKGYRLLAAVTATANEPAVPSPAPVADRIPGRTGGRARRSCLVARRLPPGIHRHGGGAAGALRARCGRRRGGGPHAGRP